MSLEELILKALEEKEFFIGIQMLCRYLNGRGYKRYGCNAQYKYPYRVKDKINPCPILCPGTKIYPGRLRYWVMKLYKKGDLYTKKISFYDSKNPSSKNSPMMKDYFRFVCINENYFKKFIKTHTLEKWIEIT